MSDGDGRRRTAIEVSCFACTASTSVRAASTGDLVRMLHDRGWDNTRGVVACRLHKGTTVMPRHRRQP